MSEQRQKHQQRNEAMLLFDIGDFIDRFHPITEATKGKANVDLLNALQYDAVTIGNNEGITLDYEDLNTLYENARFPVLVANLFHKDGTRPSWVRPYSIIPISDAFRIGVIGVTAYFAESYELLGWKVAPPLEMLESIAAEVKKQADLVILLSHLGIHEDEKIAQTMLDIDIILGGHTHHLFPEGKRIHDTLLCGAGKYGKYIGVVKLEIEESDRTYEALATVVDAESFPNSERMQRTLSIWEQQSLAKLEAEQIVELKEDLPLQWFSPSPFAKLLASALKEWCDAEIGMVNAGVLLEPLPKGIVTRKDLHRICPHPINPCKVQLRGAELKEIILQANTDRMKYLQFKGFGFRGKVMGQMVYDGVEFEMEREEDGAEYIRHMTINGEPLNPEQLYEVATIDMFTIGNFYPQIQHAPNKKYYMPEFLRDVLAWKLANQK
ncbi:2',3'-cyclic-nucleotide 2'-phosphodiesterase (5'-nucleotidase family) [Saccharococcus thermophilus]|uniref:2',3'-cyclic-nucleotide 2'-phosphodiesterase (5'-nucleotidase family) n=1 Tax=Saccharococcus thermophilus TaxID=29396 RepID=A0A846MF60_9BACL|nr:2',3'-cyclic-nucleotide 2'-phosphodiesterase (5'-nucleotidase family) [Saccharococcus thermophilus]